MLLRALALESRDTGFGLRFTTHKLCDHQPRIRPHGLDWMTSEGPLSAHMTSSGDPFAEKSRVFPQSLPLSSSPPPPLLQLIGSLKERKMKGVVQERTFPLLER